MNILRERTTLRFLVFKMFEKLQEYLTSYNIGVMLDNLLIFVMLAFVLIGFVSLFQCYNYFTMFKSLSFISMSFLIFVYLRRF